MADSNVVDLPVITRLDTAPAKVFEKALAANLTDVVIVGYDGDGNFYFTSSYADGSPVVWLLEQTKHILMTVGEE